MLPKSPAYYLVLTANKSGEQLRRINLAIAAAYKYLRYRNVAISSYKPDIPKTPALAGTSREKRLINSDWPLLAVSLQDSTYRASRQS